MGKRDKKKDKAEHVRAVPDPHDEHARARNPGMPLELDWVHSIRVNRSAVERRAATIPTRRSIKKDHQLAWLLRAIALTDLTTLQGDDTPGRVRRLCAKARQPIEREILEGIGAGELDLHVAAVCVYHEMVSVAVEALEGSGIPVAAVAAGFPAGLSPLPERIREVEASVAAGATEIDIVINRAHLFTGDWVAMYDEVRAFREACGNAHLKSIIATGDLAILRNVARASVVCMMAGSDFVKTSTGKEKVNATLPVSLTMVRMVREYLERTGHEVGFKAAGGISQAKQALAYLAMMKDELGRAWLEPELFRFGASSLVGDIERQLEYHATGRYSAAFRHPMT